MAGDKFNVDIPDQIIQDATALLDQVDTVMQPFFQHITNKEKRYLPKISDELSPFANKVNRYIDTNPEYNPPFLDVVETHKDFMNFRKVRPLLERVQALEREVADIGIVAGSDAYIHFLSYYNSVKKASELGEPGASTIYEELSKQFPGRKKKTPPDTE